MHHSSTYALIATAEFQAGSKSNGNDSLKPIMARVPYARVSTADLLLVVAVGAPVCGFTKLLPVLLLRRFAGTSGNTGRYCRRMHQSCLDMRMDGLYRRIRHRSHNLFAKCTRCDLPLHQTRARGSAAADVLQQSRQK